MARGRGRRRERPHRPRELGPRVFPRGRWFAIDLRPWGGGRKTLRDPDDDAWPEGGERLEAVEANREVAERWKWSYVDDIRAAALDRHLGRSPGRRLGAAVAEWLEHRERTVAPNTLASNRAVVHRIRDRFGADATLAQVTTPALQRYFDRLLDDGYAASTLKTEKYILSAFFDHFGDHNPARRVVLPAPPDEDARAWTDAELVTLRKAADAVDAQRRTPPSARLAVELAVATGARQQELFALEWRHLRPRDYTVRIARQLERGTRRFRPLKGKRARTAVVLPGWWDRHDPDARGLVLPAADGRPYDYRASCALVQRILDTANLNEPGAGWHRCRHSYARLFLEGGGWMDELQSSLGHASIRTTERYYEHFATEKRAGFATARIYGEGRRLRLVE